MTATDLPGTGRVLDKFVFTRGGRALEASLARLAHAAGYGPAAAALRIGANLRGFTLQENTSIESVFASEGPGPGNLRLELGLVRNVPRLRADCQKLFEYSLSNSLAIRVQALKMIVTLFIRFPYLSTYFDVPEMMGSFQRAHELRNSCIHTGFLTAEEILVDDLSQMAYACLVPAESSQSVSRLVDHLAENTKRATESNRLAFLPDTRLVRECCTDPERSFAALRFTGIILRHTILASGEDFYVKLSSAMSDFWQQLIDCVAFHLRGPHARTCGCHRGYDDADGLHTDCDFDELSEMRAERLDAEGVDLFSETVLEMLFRAAVWDPLFSKNPHPRLVVLVRKAIWLFRPSLVQMFCPNSTFVALTKLEPFFISSFGEAAE
ncbi:hypothetical protein M0805_002078 [Coniferiporia weirii]|nr:hypothetical protein M0805_002078 [Coniferiporia weirii]